MQQSPIKRNNHNNKPLFGIIAGIVLGALLGGLWPEAGLTLKFVGDLFIRFLMMIVMPLIIAAMVSGIARLGDISQLGSLGSRTLGYYIGTTALAVITGIVLVLKAVNLPVEGIALILIIDWFLDRCRTTVNVWGDSVGAGIIDRKVKG